MNKKIKISREHQNDIIKEFNGITRQTVYNALCYRSFSEQAKKIRARAKELLKAEAEKVEDCIPSAKSLPQVCRFSLWFSIKK